MSTSTPSTPTSFASGIAPSFCRLSIIQSQAPMRYRCDACGHTFEQFQSIKADPIKKCPKCAKNKVHRLIGTGAGLIFKGSGFYITDYRSDSYKDAAKSDSAGGSGNGEATKTESKSDSTKSDGSSGSGGEKKSTPPAETKPAAKSDKADKPATASSDAAPSKPAESKAPATPAPAKPASDPKPTKKSK